jgi:hypothetical protein
MLQHRVYKLKSETKYKVMSVKKGNGSLLDRKARWQHPEAL